MIRLELTLEETALGTLKDIVVDTAALCGTCSGSRSAGGTAPAQCTSCGGSGRKQRMWTSSQDRCPKCDGTGMRPVHPCFACNGDGRVRNRRTLTIKIPGGVENAMRIQLAGEGEVGPGGGPPGDLYVEVAELPHRVFERVGDDLHCTVTVPTAVAQSGGTIPLDTLDGRKTLRIPAGIRDGQTLRLARLGVTHLRVGGRGDALVHVTTHG
jgi:molecular chaperone DnaJ